MQLNGIGAGHSAEVHHVTNCMYSHEAAARKSGGGGPTSSGENAAPAPAGQQEGQFSLSAWLERTLGGGKRLLARIWGGNEIAAIGEPGDQTGEAQTPAQIGAENAAELSADVAGQGESRPDADRLPGTPQIAAAATAVPQPQVMQNSPYFSAVYSPETVKQTIWQRVRVKFRDMAGQLADHLPGNFFSTQARSFFQAKNGQGRERPRGDMRRRSKYRKDEVEIDCILTDDAYLLDTYDRKGEYSTLSAGQKGTVAHLDKI